LKDLALQELGADTPTRNLTPESPGLVAIAGGFRETAFDDLENMAL
jgi:hypothetical protein